MTNTKTTTNTQYADNIDQLLNTLHVTVRDLIDSVDKLEKQCRIDAIRDFELDELDFYSDNNNTPILSIHDLK